jgi:hypothetical protein
MFVYKRRQSLAKGPYGIRHCAHGQHQKTQNFYIYTKGYLMNNIVYIVGAVVIILAVLSFVGLR